MKVAVSSHWQDLSNPHPAQGGEIEMDPDRSSEASKCQQVRLWLWADSRWICQGISVKEKLPLG